MVCKEDLTSALQGTDIKALEVLRKEALDAIKLFDKKVSNLEAELQEVSGLEAELIAEQIDYIKENDYTDWNKFVYKTCSARIAELK